MASLIESMMGHIVSSAVADAGPQTLEAIKANHDSLETIAHIDKTKARGIIMMAVHQEGDRIMLSSALSGTPSVLMALHKALHLLMQQATVQDAMQRGQMDPMEAEFMSMLLGLNESTSYLQTGEEISRPPTDTPQ